MYIADKAPLIDKTDPAKSTFQQIKFESGQLKETSISICPYEMYEMEMLDRSLLSLQRTEEAYVDINNRLIDNVNKRKDRLNNLN